MVINFFNNKKNKKSESSNITKNPEIENLESRISKLREQENKLMSTYNTLQTQYKNTKDDEKKIRLRIDFLSNDYEKNKKNIEKNINGLEAKQESLVGEIQRQEDLLKGTYLLDPNNNFVTNI